MSEITTSQSTSETSRDKAQRQLITVVKRIASIAGATQHALSYFLGVGGVATLYLIWQAYSPESGLWWNGLKCVLLVWPALLLVFVWIVLGDLSDVPESVAKLNQDTRTAYSGMKDVKIREPKGLRGMFRVLNTFRREGSLSVIFDTVGGVSLLLNPLFLFFIALACVSVILLSFIGLLIVIF